MVSNETEVEKLPDSRNTGTFIGTDIAPDPEVGDPPDGGIKRIPPLASGSELGLEVGEPPGCSGGCTPLTFGHKADPSNGQAFLFHDGNKRVPSLATSNEPGTEVGEPPGYGGGCTPSVFGPKADPEVGEPPGNGQTSLFPDCGLRTAPSSGFGWRGISGA